MLKGNATADAELHPFGIGKTTLGAVHAASLLPWSLAGKRNEEETRRLQSQKISLIAGPGCVQYSPWPLAVRPELFGYAQDRLRASEVEGRLAGGRFDFAAVAATLSANGLRENACSACK
jgi:hypothetical protein